MSGQTKRRIRAGAAGAALAVTILLALLRLGMIGPLPAGSPDDLLRLLVAVALLLVAALTHGTHPTTAWLATIGSATVVALDLAIYARDGQPHTDLALARQWRTMPRCQRKTVPGVTTSRIAAGRSTGGVPAGSASHARSGHVSRE